MYGAILGDMIGAPYEFDRSPKKKEFPLFIRNSEFTDDSVMTIAVAEALLDTIGKDDDKIKDALVNSMCKWGKRYPDAGYGNRFYGWLRDENHAPYGSFGNGSAMRVSPAGWLSDTMDGTRRIGYDLSRTCDEIRPTYHHVESCQETVPEAITAFLEGDSFEDVIRTAVSLGGDCDTLTCIAGSIAEAFYSIPEEMITECRNRLPKDMLAVLDRFAEIKLEKEPAFHDRFLDGNEMIETAIHVYSSRASKKRMAAVLDAIRQRMHEDGHFVIPVLVSEDGTEYACRTVKSKDGKEWVVVFTSHSEYVKGSQSKIISKSIDAMLKTCNGTEAQGIVINPWGESFKLTTDLINMILEADGGVEYTVPDDEITPELLEDGMFLKRAIGICNRNRTEQNLIRLMRILRDSWIWIPCSAILTDADYAAWEQVVKEAVQNGDLESLVGKTVSNQDNIRMVPDILQNGEDFFFPVFTSAEEMGDYGQDFSKIERHFLEAVALARNNDKNVFGIVINAFSEPSVIPRDMCEMIEKMPSAFEQKEESQNEKNKN